jgi:putative membrane protein
MEFPGWNGFLGTRASLMVDLVVVAMVVVVVVMGWSIHQVKYHQRYTLHKRVQLVLAVALAVTITAFETDIRLHGWEDRAAGILGGSASKAVWTSLWIHLFFALTTVVLWPTVLVLALRRFPSPAAPSSHSASHRRWARLAAWDMFLTAVSGWVFYALAFVG